MFLSGRGKVKKNQWRHQRKTTIIILLLLLSIFRLPLVFYVVFVCFIRNFVRLMIDHCWQQNHHKPTTSSRNDNITSNKNDSSRSNNSSQQSKAGVCYFRSSSISSWTMLLLVVVVWRSLLEGKSTYEATATTRSSFAYVVDVVGDSRAYYQAIRNPWQQWSETP